MTSRAPTRLIAIALLALIGLSGVSAGGSLLTAAGGSGAPSPDVRNAGLGIGAAIAGYGIACLFAAAGLWSRSRWGWLLGIAIIGLGLVALLISTAIAGLDAILGLGLAVWIGTLVCLLTPGARPAPSP